MSILLFIQKYSKIAELNILIDTTTPCILFIPQLQNSQPGKMSNFQFSSAYNCTLMFFPLSIWFNYIHHQAGERARNRFHCWLKKLIPGRGLSAWYILQFSTDGVNIKKWTLNRHSFAEEVSNSFIHFFRAGWEKRRRRSEVVVCRVIASSSFDGNKYETIRKAVE